MNNTQEFDVCFKLATQETKDPESCYQARAAKTIFNNAFYTTIGVSLFSVLGIPSIIAIFGLISRRIACCEGILENLSNSDADTTAIPVPAAETPAQGSGKILTLRFLQSLSIAIPSAVSAVSIGWAFEFWNNLNHSEAACHY